MKASAVIVAGGMGKRMGADIPKQLLMLGGMSILERTLRPFLACGEIGEIVITAADEIIDSAKTPEERAELTRVRDEVDAAAQARIHQLDAEIARLEKENAELRKR